MLNKLSFKREKILDIQKALKSADVNQDNKLDFEEWRATLKSYVLQPFCFYLNGEHSKRLTRICLLKRNPCTLSIFAWIRASLVHYAKTNVVIHIYVEISFKVIQGKCERSIQTYFIL